MASILQILRDWHLEVEEQAALLGLPENTKPRALLRMATHGSELLTEDFLHRSHCLLAIKNATESLYPHNAHAASLWITTPNMLFNNVTPLRIMIAEGLAGMQRVINHLDGNCDWN